MVIPPINLSSASLLREKRVAVIVFSYFPSDPRVYREAVTLDEAGAEVDLLCLRKSLEEPVKETINGVNVTRVPVKKSRAGKLAYVKQYLAFTALALAWLTRRSLARRYDLVHVHNMPDFLVFSALFAKLRGSKIVLDLHDPMPEVFIAKYGLSADGKLLKLLRLNEKLSMAFADLVLTPNLAFRKLFASRSGPEEKIRIIMNSPLERVFPLRSPEYSARREKNTENFILMYHGTLVERHGLHIAIRAFKDLSESIPGLLFRIYGAETPYLLETVLPLIKGLGLESRVTYCGEQSQEVIAKAITECDLGIIPNLRSVFTEINFPTRIFEYLALGKPVIVPQTPGIADYFGPENMLFFHWGNEEEEKKELAAKIQWVFEHPKEVRSLVEVGQKVYLNHNWTRQRTAFLQTISELLAH